MRERHYETERSSFLVVLRTPIETTKNLRGVEMSEITNEYVTSLLVIVSKEEMEKYYSSFCGYFDCKLQKLLNGISFCM